MHEYSLVRAMVERVEAAVRENKAKGVHRLRVSVGELSGVEPELFRSAYEVFREGTVCAKASLDVTLVRARYTCPNCGRAFEPGEVLRCAGCDRAAHLNAGSDELLLESIELEVP
ncbi:MAG TPA: hydrogenase maturation nickel metallochaperone HypA [Anaeromyxobacteraceae bacterium]|nr:hydrogenase maturation nickel metallochaperone HypA [Anaeromyxobacteraceae bacterium]